MRLRKNRLALALMATFLIAAFLFYSRPRKAHPRPKILVLSPCCIRYSQLLLSESKATYTPNLQELGKSSIIFTQAISQSTQPAASTEENPLGADLALLKRNGYSWKRFGDGPDAMAQIRASLEKPDPFLYVVVTKSLHPPLIKPREMFNLGQSGLKKPPYNFARFLDSRQQQLVLELFQNPDKYPEREPMRLFLFSGNERGAVSRLLDSEKISRWKRSKNFAEDVDLVKKVYAAALYDFDVSWREIYTEAKNREDTVLIVAGDHGFSIMENDHLFFTKSLSETELRVPLILHFPGIKENQYINWQADMMSLPSFLNELADGKVTTENLLGKLELLHKDEIFLSNENGILGIRSKNKWKYSMNVASGDQALYDLDNDPGETTNLVIKESQISGIFEQRIWKNFTQKK